jgi:hypothetical protein
LDRPDGLPDHIEVTFLVGPFRYGIQPGVVVVGIDGDRALRRFKVDPAGPAAVSCSDFKVPARVKAAANKYT